MTILDAIKTRHAVRKYADKPIETAKVATLRSEIERLNAESGLNVQLVLLAQTLGLNTCWVGLTYKKIPGTYTLRDGDIVHCVISLGYGTTPGVQHPLKPVEQFYESEGLPPKWFQDGMEAAMLAPTAVNQQKFKFILHEGNKVEAKTSFSMAGYTNIDLGIVKYHFEVGAGKDCFTWL